MASRLNLGEQADVIALDFSKAFDKVPHARLLQYFVSWSFMEYGVHAYFRWIKEFLTDRKQQIDNKFSTPSTVLSGVPQGSVLSPLLFQLPPV